jgi:hypothetical protein
MKSNSNIFGKDVLKLGYAKIRDENKVWLRPDQAMLEKGIEKS